MNAFSYVRANDVETAVNEIAPSDGQRVKFIAGGTNLIDLMKENVARPNRLVDITHLPFKAIEALHDGGLRIGALVTNADVAYDPQVMQRYPLLSKALLAGASPQLRNMATVGGNLLQRTRCYYFYDLATPCNKRTPGAGCPAIEGYNRIHAILGTSEHCIATHPSDMCVALAALDATVHVTSQSGPRAIPFADFHRLPGDTPHLDTNLRPDELITAVTLPAQGFAEHACYLKVRDRASYAFALVSVAAALKIETSANGNIITDARLALGGVAHKPWRDLSVEAQLQGQPATRATFQAAAQSMLAPAQGYGANTFKIELARRAIVRAFEQAASGQAASEQAASKQVG